MLAKSEEETKQIYLKISNVFLIKVQIQFFSNIAISFFFFFTYYCKTILHSHLANNANKSFWLAF